MMRSASPILAALLILAALCACTPPAPPELAVGQTWTVQSRPSDGATTVTVLHIAHSSPMGEVVFVSINNAVITLPDKRQTNKLFPVAFTLPALKQSLKDFQFNQGKSIPYEAHAAVWQALAAQGRGSEFTYTMPLAQALDLFEQGKTGPWALALPAATPGRAAPSQ